MKGFNIKVFIIIYTWIIKWVNEFICFFSYISWRTIEREGKISKKKEKKNEKEDRKKRSKSILVVKVCTQLL